MISVEGLKEKLKEIKESDKFKEWHEKHFHAYLCSVFISEGLQFDFYDTETDKITSFNEDEVLEEQEIFRKEKKKLVKLKLDDVKIKLEEVKKVIEKVLEEKGRVEKSTKDIIFLQVYEGKVIWNVTYITDCYNILNVKVDAKTGEVLFEKIESALSWKAN